MPSNSLDITLFERVIACWICGGTAFVPYHRLRMDLAIYESQDPELARYRDLTLALHRCVSCGFGQPEALPTLPQFFDRMYDQRWSDDWIVSEFRNGAKDLIFKRTLEAVRKSSNGCGAGKPARFLDVGAHVGRLLFLAREQGWQCEGIELNPKTRAYAESVTGLKVHHRNAQQLASSGERYRVVTLIDVLEHIPRPVELLRTLHALLEEGGCLVVKVPNGRAQHLKETWKSRLVPGYRATLADNLVHVNHFNPRALELALRNAGFDQIRVGQGAPEEIPPVTGFRALIRNRMRPCFLGFYLLESLPSSWVSSLFLHLQAVAIKPGPHTSR